MRWFDDGVNSSDRGWGDLEAAVISGDFTFDVNNRTNFWEIEFILFSLFVVCIIDIRSGGAIINSERIIANLHNLDVDINFQTLGKILDGGIGDGDCTLGNDWFAIGADIESGGDNVGGAVFQGRDLAVFINGEDGLIFGTPSDFIEFGWVSWVSGDDFSGESAFFTNLEGELGRAEVNGSDGSATVLDLNLDFGGDGGVGFGSGSNGDFAFC